MKKLKLKSSKTKEDELSKLDKDVLQHKLLEYELHDHYTTQAKTVGHLEIKACTTDGKCVVIRKDISSTETPVESTCE
jgi:hypothetical protein